MGAASLEFLTGGGQCGALARALDWGETPLGPPEDWPQSLRIATTICLRSRFGMCVFWGNELTTIYNDGYAPMLGVKHPAAMGMPLSAVWPEIWGEIGPMLEGVIQTGEATWSDDERLVLERHGFAETAYFTWSFSPIRDEDRGEVLGVFTAVKETTARVLATRRLRALTRLADRMAGASTYSGVAQAAVQALTETGLDVPGAALYQLTPTGAPAAIAWAGISGEPQAAWGVEAARAVDGEIRVFDPGVAPGRAVMLPVAAPGNPRPVGALMLCPSDQLPLDDVYMRFLSLITRNVASALASAAGYESERHRALEMEAIAITLQRSLLPRSLPDTPGVDMAGHYIPAGRALEVGGDFYDATELPDGRIALAIGDVAGHGALAAAVMGQLRHALRAYALEGRAPASLIAQLDRLVIDSELTMTTCLCGLFDPASGQFVYSRAGHPPALLRSSTDVIRLDDALTVPLGAHTRAGETEAAAQLAVGDTLLLYTDGLVERRGEALDAGIARLAGRLAAASGDARAICEDLAATVGSHPDDDVALLVMTRQPDPERGSRGGRRQSVRAAAQAKAAAPAGSQRAPLRPTPATRTPPAA